MTKIQIFLDIAFYKLEYLMDIQKSKYRFAQSIFFNVVYSSNLTYTE